MAKQRPTLRTLEPNREVMMDGQQKIKLVAIEEITTQETFANLFSMHPNVLHEITHSMRTSGFDPARPIVLNTEMVVIEGHTRLQAAKDAQLQYVPVIMKSFANDEEALYYALREQTARRNLTPQELIQAINQLDQLYGDGKAQSGEGRRLDRLASELGVGASTIAKARYLQKHLPKDIHGKIEEPIKSIHASYQQLKQREQEQQELANQSVPQKDPMALHVKHNPADNSYQFYHHEHLLITLHACEHYDQNAIRLILEKTLASKN